MNKMIELPISIPSGHEWIKGDLTLPERILFAHGGGSSRHSPRNQYVARYMNQNGLGTLLMDLLTSKEEKGDRIRRSALCFEDPAEGRILCCVNYLKK